MRSHRRIIHAAVTAALIMALAAAVSSAEEFDVVNGEFFRAQWSSFTITTGAGRIVCPVTLEGSFAAASFTSTAGTRVASVTRASLGGCTENTATILSETLPWTVQYSSFAGTLPNITSLTFRTIGASFRGTAAGVTCLFRSTTERPMNFSATRSTAAESTGQITGTRLDESARIPLTGAFCEGTEGTVSGSGSLLSTVDAEGDGERAYFFLNRVGVDLVNGVAPPVENTLRDVGLNANAEATLVMTNRNTKYRVRLIAVTIVNPERYELLNPAERCGAEVTVLLRGRATICNIRIRRRMETMMGQNSRVRITYRYPGERFFGILTYEQTFNVIAN
jgi:hypothetical protein